MNLKNKYGEFEPHLEDIICFLKERLAESQKNKVSINSGYFKLGVHLCKTFNFIRFQAKHQRSKSKFGQ